MSFIDKIRALIPAKKLDEFEALVEEVAEVAEHVPGHVGAVASLIDDIIEIRRRVRNAPAQIVAQAGVTGVMPEDEFNRRVLAVLDAHEASLAAAEQARNAEV